MNRLFIINSFLLTIAAMIWGAGFIGTKWTFTDYGPYWSNTIRFILASLFILPFLFYKFKRNRGFQFYKAPLLCSVLLFLGMITQTIGLKYTTVSKSGFLTTFYAFFTPIILMMLYRYRYQKTFWPLLATSLFGIFMLCDMSFNHFNIGDFWTLVCAFIFSFHIILIGNIANNYNAIELNGMQCVGVMFLSIPCAFYFEGVPDLGPALVLDFKPGSTLLGFIILGIFSSNIAFSIQAHAQKFIPPHFVSLLFLFESVFAALLGNIFLGEKLSALNFFGCLVVLTSVSLVPFYGRRISRSEAKSI